MVFADTSSLVAPTAPLWMLTFMVLCLPVTAITTWYFVRWWLSPIDPAADRQRPSGHPVAGVAWPSAVPRDAGGDGPHRRGLPGGGRRRPVPWQPTRGTPCSVRVFSGQLPPLAGLAVIRLFGRGSAATVGVRVGRVGPTLLRRRGGVCGDLPVCLAATWINIIVAGMMGVAPKVHLLLRRSRRRRGVGGARVALQAGVLASLAEEFMYRGVLMMSLLKQTGAAPPSPLSSAFFAIMHLPSQPQAVLPSFPLRGDGLRGLSDAELPGAVVTHSLFNTLMVLGKFWGGRPGKRLLSSVVPPDILFHKE